MLARSVGRCLSLGTKPSHGGVSLLRSSGNYSSVLCRGISNESTLSFSDAHSPYRALVEAHPKPPRLYLPSLDQTCENYLNNVLPMLENPDQIERTKAVVQQFKTSEGVLLQKLLQEYDLARANSSYVAEFWDDMYLEGPWPLPVNVNPFLQFLEPAFKNPTSADRVARTTKIASGLLKFCVEMRAGRLETEWKTPNKHPFDMSQFYRLFGTTRIARPGRDISATFGPHDSRHLVVLHNKKYYSFDVLNDKGEQISDSLLAASFAKVLSDSSPGEGEDIGALTTLDRDEWGGIRLNLESNPTNRETLNKIDTALFLVCFDDASPSTSEEISSLLLHGHPGKRWYDKSFSLVVFKNGISGCNFEHSWGDGATWVSFINKALGYMPKVKVPTNIQSETPSVQKLNWNIRPYIKHEISKASDFSKSLFDSIDTKVFSFDNWGREEIKRVGLSPDAFVQMAFQVAYYTLHKQIPPTYESASTRHYLRGRTETIRTVSQDSANLVKLIANTRLMESPSVANARSVKELLRKACAQHVVKTANALEGKGSDRHLFALFNIAKKAHKLANDGTPFVPPALYSDPSYSRYHHILVSTSNLSTPTLALFGFGATSSDGYGFGYNILSDKVVANITSFKDQGTSSAAFERTLRRAMEMLRFSVTA